MLKCVVILVTYKYFECNFNSKKMQKSFSYYQLNTCIIIIKHSVLEHQSKFWERRKGYKGGWILKCSVRRDS